MKQNLIYINNLKALAVLLVILGHAVQYSVSEFDKNIMFNLIYSFHMPLFFFISGFLLNYSRRNNFLARRIKSLVIPYLSWAFFYCFYYGWWNHLNITISYFGDYWRDIFKSPDNGGLWFLWVLFLCNLFYFVFAEVKYKYLTFLTVLIIVNVIYIFPFTHLLGLSLFRWHFLFFIAGLFFGEKKYIEKYKSSSMIYLALAFAFLSVPFFVRNSLIINLKGGYKILQLFINLVSAFSVIIFLNLLFCRVLNIYNKLLEWISSKSLEFYAVQFIFLNVVIRNLQLLNLNAIYVEILSFILVTILSVLLILLIDRSGFLRKWLFGKF